MNRKGFALLVLLIVVVGISIVVGSTWYLLQKPVPVSTSSLAQPNYNPTSTVIQGTSTAPPPASTSTTKTIKNQKTPSISKEAALAIVKNHGIDIATSFSIVLNPANQYFFEGYTGPGSPIRITGWFWEVNITIPDRDPTCSKERVLYIDATTGDFYDLGIAEACA